MPAASLRLSPAAEADLQESYDWYERRTTGLGESFLDEVGSQLSVI